MDVPRPIIPASAAIYGAPPPGLADVPAGSPQTSPLVPGSVPLEAWAPGTLDAMTMLAPPGTIERRYALATMLRALAPGGAFAVLAQKSAGGARLARELADLGAPSETTARAHHRICRGRRPATLDEAALGEAFETGAPRRVPGLGLWSQPGIFSWDRIDTGTMLLAEALAPLAGHGADLGCGIGILAHAVLASSAVTRLDLVDVDRRAVESARRNVDDPRVRFAWADVAAGTSLSRLDFVVMNPPFHAAGEEQRSLGQLFIRRAAEALRTGGVLWMVANRHLPYEAVLKPLFRRATPKVEAHGFKVIEAVK